MRPVPIFVYCPPNQQPEYAPDPPHLGCGKLGHPIIWIAIGKPGFTVTFPTAHSPWNQPMTFKTQGIFLKTPPTKAKGVFEYTFDCGGGVSADPQIEVEDGALAFLMARKLTFGLGFAAGVAACLVKDLVLKKR